VLDFQIFIEKSSSRKMHDLSFWKNREFSGFFV